MLTLAIAPLPLACGQFGADTQASATEGGTSGEGGGEGGAVPDGTGPASADGPSGGEIGDGGLADGAILPFGPTCQPGDTMETEPNDDAGATNLITSPFCGTLSAGTDVDRFAITVDGTDPIKIGWSRAGNATFHIAGPGIDFAPAARSGGGFTEHALSTSKPPGIFAITVQGDAQSYRLLITR